MRQSKSIKINEINTINQFHNLRDVWSKIQNECIDDTIFLTWEKMEPLVNRMTTRQSIKILYATDGDQVVAIMPLRRTMINVIGEFGYTVIEPLAKDNTDYSDLISCAKQKDILFHFLSYLFKQKDWDIFYFTDLAETSHTLDFFKSTCDNLPKFEIENSWICPFVEIPKSKEQLLANINSNFRRSLRRQLRALERKGWRLEVKNHDELYSLDYSINILFTLHQKRWMSKGEPGVFKKQRNRDISSETAEHFNKKNWLKMYFLFINDKPVAANLSLEYKNKMYGHLCGFDPDYSKYGVGNLLQLKVLEDCVERGILEYDFMQGAESYKFRWTTKYRQIKNVRFINRKTSSILVNLVLRDLPFGVLIAKKALRLIKS